MHVVELHRYPVKSVGGRSVTALELEPWGPAGDRRWAVVDGSGRLKTARTVPRLLALSADARPDGITLATPTGESLTVAAPTHGELVDTTITRAAPARDAGDAAASFLRDATGESLRLVWQADPRTRSVNPRNGGIDGETLSFADAGPVLLTAMTSLSELQQRVGPDEPVEMERFRPNVVIDGDRPFDEHTWSAVRIGDVRCRVQQRCDRCMMTTIDPRTGDRGDEPLATLRREYTIDGQPVFGLRLVPERGGTVRIGDAVVPERVDG